MIHYSLITKIVDVTLCVKDYFCFFNLFTKAVCKYRNRGWDIKALGWLRSLSRELLLEELRHTKKR